jgi:hypothetical protein
MFGILIVTQLLVNTIQKEQLLKLSLKVKLQSLKKKQATKFLGSSVLTQVSMMVI